MATTRRAYATLPVLSLFLLGALLLPAVARADHDRDDAPTPRRGPEFGLGMHAAWYSPVPNDSFGGLGVSLRHPIDNRVTFEASGSYFDVQDASLANPYSVRAYPIQASLLGYLLPGSPIQVYGIAGVGFEGSDVHDEALGRSWHYNRAGGHMGIGGQITAGRLSFELDWRWILYANPRQSTTAPPPPFADRDARLFRAGMSVYF